MNGDNAGVKVKVDWKLVKYDGEAPQEGEVKTPVEVLEGGDSFKEIANGTD